MSCIKTGFHARLVPYDAWVVGDAFAEEGVFIFRISHTNYVKPIRERMHFRILDWTLWFDQDRDTPSTMICRYEQVISFNSVDGVPSDV